MRPSDALTLSEVAGKTDLARAVVRRFLYTLVELGYVVTDGKYFRLTAKILGLGFAYLSSFSLPKIAERFLEEVTLKLKNPPPLRFLTDMTSSISRESKPVASCLFL